MNKNIQHILLQGENETTEFKTSFNDEVIISLVAFANTKGGTVYVGVKDNGSVSGVEVGKETLQKWINEIKNKTTPSLIPDVGIIEIQRTTIAWLEIQEYPIKPVSIKGKCFKRIANSNHLMSVEEIANEHLKTINSSWDFYIDSNHSLSDISLDKISRFIHGIEQRTETVISYTPIEFLSKMEMLRDGKLTFGAYLLFVADYCPISDVQIGRFKSDITIIDSITLNTDLFSEVNEIIAFIKKHLNVEYIISGEPQRTERFDYPLDAIREIVINMVVHRDYRDSSGSIIKIYDNRIEFFNPGKLFGGITVTDLMSGNYVSKSRNKLIAKAFKEAGLIERYGSGILRIHKICKDYGIVEPVFEEISNGFRVVLYNDKLKDQVDKVTDGVTDRVAEKVVEKVVDRVVEKVAEDLTANITENQRIIVECIVKNPTITARELADIIRISHRKTQENIAKLKALNIIERIGPAKGGYWKVIKGQS